MNRCEVDHKYILNASSKARSLSQIVSANNVTMDVDMDIDSQLLREFSAMGTTDKEVLIAQFQKLLGDQRITSQECDFFLDMNNWYV